MGESHHGGAPGAPNAPPLGLGGIGAPLEALRQRLIESAATLAAVVEPAGKALVIEASNALAQQVCRIAVVGQIKSGKSSFINALVQDPTLLPTDVTPWTTAITNLHFGQTAPGNHAAVFQFFSEGEWQNLANGGGRIRELTQRLVPGFEPELLRQHVEALKRRAGVKLGAEFQQLLGRAHCFPAIKSDVLCHYVCSGDFAPNPGAAALGRYSDITKTADLYCGRGPFAYPVTVIDTPGTNDPFLIRDELTRRSLESADLYIVVLTARQPLSESDVSLLRLMHGLNKERIIVFVNRIDDLADVGRDLSDVLSFVEKKLEEEFPGCVIPIIAGSAWWASSALKLDGPVLDRLFERRSLGYIGDLGLIPHEELARSAMDYAAHRERLRRALIATSGLPAMYSVVNELMGSSQAAQALAQIASSFSEMARASESAARSELESLTTASNGAATAPPFSQGHIGLLEQETRALNEVAVQIAESGTNIEAQLVEIIHEEMDDMRAALTAAVNRHAGVEREVLYDTLRRGRAPRVWTHEGIELRRRLAGVFTEKFQRSAARVLEFQARVAPELKRVLRLIAPGASPAMEPDRAALRGIPTPAVAPLGRFVALDLDGSWWTAFLRGRPSPATCGEQIEALIKSEFEPVVEDLVRSAERALSTYCATTTRWSFGICLNIVQALERRREQLARRYGALDGEGGQSTEDASRARARQAAELVERVKLCGALGRQLDGVVGEFAGSFSHAQRLAS